MFDRFLKGSTGIVPVAAFFSLSLLLQSCATYQGKVEQARHSIQSGDYGRAALYLEPLAAKPGDDQLIYLLDYAVALHLAGRYQDSIDALLKADELAEIQDYHSVSKIAGSLLINEEMVQYKGEYFEKLLINAFLAINFTMLGDMDAALVETRRMNEKLEKLKADGVAKREQNEFAIYLSAVLWEADRKWDDAYIAYEQFYKLNPDFHFIGEDLIRAAKKARRHEAEKKWKKKFSEVKLRKEWSDPKFGEVIVIYQQGWGPKKVFNPENYRFPMLRSSPTYTRQAEVQLEGLAPVKTQVVHNITDIAVSSMNAYYASLIAKKLAAVATKAVVADQIRQKNAVLGDLAWIAMNLADRADLRHWSTLPESFQIARILVPAGTYKLSIQGLNSMGTASSEKIENVEIEVKPGRKSFYSWRSVN